MSLYRMSNRITMITRGALIAALYVVLVFLFQPISFGAVQFRVAEALTVLPFLWLEAVPGLFIGCLIANMFGGLGPWDIFLGSAATLLAAGISYFSPGLFLAALSPVVVNGLIVGSYLTLVLGLPMPVCLSILYVAAGEAMACFALGIPLVRLLERAGLRREYAEKNKDLK